MHPLRSLSTGNDSADRLFNGPNGPGGRELLAPCVGMYLAQRGAARWQTPITA